MFCYKNSKAYNKTVFAIVRIKRYYTHTLKQTEQHKMQNAQNAQNFTKVIAIGAMEAVIMFNYCKATNVYTVQHISNTYEDEELAAAIAQLNFVVSANSTQNEILLNFCTQFNNAQKIHTFSFAEF